MSASFLNHLDAIVTFVVGSFAIFLYLKQKSDDKRAAAQLILQEVRYAEQQIRNARDKQNQYSLAVKLLPTNSWSKSIHLFVKRLEAPEIDIISQFYSQASFIDMMIVKITDKKSNVSFKDLQEAKCINETLQPDSNKTDTFLGQVAMVANGLLGEISASKIELIYNTPAVKKLEIVAKTGLFRSMLRRIISGDI